MTIEINSFFGSISNSMFSATGLNRIFSSVIYTSLATTVMVIILIILIYPPQKNSPTWLIVKLFLYVFGGILIVFSVHGSFIKNNYMEKYQNNSVNKLMNNIHGGKAVYEGDFIAVQPNLNHIRDPDSELEESGESAEDAAEPVSLSAMISDLEKKV